MKYIVKPLKKYELGFCVKTCLCFGENCACVGPVLEGYVAMPGDVIIDLDELVNESSV